MTAVTCDGANPVNAGRAMPAWPDRAGRLIDPLSRRPLRFDTSCTLTDGHRRWPVIEGICFLREDREALRVEVVGRLDAGEPQSGLALLLTDRDDFAPGPPIDELTASEVIKEVDTGSLTLRGAMECLGYGPVGDYFAHRESLPTFLSGLGLLMRHWPGNDTPIIDVACGIGSFLRSVTRHSHLACGIDVVFSKLWLARRFVCPSAPTICADVVRGWPLEPSSPSWPIALFCHDAFYFLPEKSRVLSSLHRLAGPRGRILIGHAHNRLFDHRGVAGSPLTPAEYVELLPNATLYDDAELVRVPLGETASPKESGELSEAEAIAMAWSAEGSPRPVGHLPDLGLPPAGSRLRLNPLLSTLGNTLSIAWPTERLRDEFKNTCSYLIEGSAPTEEIIAMAVSGSVSGPEAVDLAHRRILVDLPERW